MFVNTEHCAEILNLFETTMSFPTQGQKHLNKLLPLTMELFNIRSFQYRSSCIFHHFLCQEQYTLGNLALGQVFDHNREEEWSLSCI